MLAPRMLPPLELLISDIPLRKTQIANHLGITTRTLENYLKKQNAPRSVLLALYWETRWGKSHISAETTNYAQMNAALASSTKKCNEQLQNHIKVLEADFYHNYFNTSSANLPVWSTSSLKSRPMNSTAPAKHNFSLFSKNTKIEGG